MVVNTDGRGGQPLTKRFRVYTNDPGQSLTMLTVTGAVNGYVEVHPQRVRLVGRLGEHLTAQVRIVPKKQYPFIVKTVRARNGKHVRVALEPDAQEPAKEGYLLTVTSTKSDPGSFVDHIVLQTDLKEKPTIGIPVSGHLYSKPGSTRKK